MQAVNDTAGREAEKIKVSLNIPSRSHGKCSNSVRGHTVVMLFMGLYIFTIFIVAMVIVVNGLAGDDGSRAHSIRNPIWMREGIELKDSVVSHFNYHVRGNVREWKSVINSPHAFFKGVYELFHLPNVLISGHFIQPDTKVCEVSTHGFKFTIHFSSCDAESGLVVHGSHGLDAIDKCG